MVVLQSRKFWLIIGGIVLATVTVPLVYFVFRFGTHLAAEEDTKTAIRLVMIVVGSCFSSLLFSLAFIDFRIRRLRRQQMWLLDAVNWNIEQLKAHGLHEKPDMQTAHKPKSENRWPWGLHHTESLGHLDAAARKWWVLYDPSDLTTAPTNEMVSEWLQTERNISRDKARAIASMLRPDGLPTGPRR